MKLYYMPGACSLAPHIVINELGLDVKLIEVDHGTHKTQEGQNFYEINPLGYVPVLELDDGTRLSEGAAIVQYLADLEPGAGLVPVNGARERYRLQAWLNFLASEIHKGFSPLLHARLSGKYGIETAKPKLEKRFAWLNEELAGRDYLMGDDYSVADIYLFSLSQWGQAAWLNSIYKADIHFDELDNLKSWYLRVRDRPAVLKSMRIEGLLPIQLASEATN